MQKQEKDLNKINNKFWNFCKNNNSKLWFASFCLIIFATIFLLVMAIIPNNPAYSTTSFVYTNAMYAVKFSSNLSSYIVIFAPAGWVAFLLILITITLFVIAFIVNWNNIKAKYIDAKENKKLIQTWIHYSFLISFIVAFIILTIFIIIPIYKIIMHYRIEIQYQRNYKVLQVFDSHQPHDFQVEYQSLLVDILQ